MKEIEISTPPPPPYRLTLINHWASDSGSATLLANLEKYYQKYKLFKRNIEFSFAMEVI